MPENSTPQLLQRPDGAAIAYRRTARREPDGPATGIVFLAGFQSDMTGTKATALEAHAQASGRAFVRFDYLGHGESSGNIADGTMSRWLEDTLAVLDEVSDGPVVVVGSSMGGWLAHLVALARPDRIAGVLGVASAPDFTEDLLWAGFDRETREKLERDGVIHLDSEYSDEPYVITRALIEDGRKHLILRGPIAVTCPVRLIHGMADPDVSHALSVTLAEQLESNDVQVLLAKSGDHRLSAPEDIERLVATTEDLCRAADAL